MAIERVSTAARDQADQAARSAGLAVRTLSAPAEVQAAEALLTGVWRSEPGHVPVSADLMRSLSYFGGGYVAGAYSGDILVGACVGFLGADPAIGADPYLHSHITGVSPHARGRRVGYALKCDQRAWALEHGICTVNWTFDPLVSRNGFFNLTRLGAVATAYLVDFYGEMVDGLNAGQGSDRLMAVWSLAAGPTDEPDVGPLIAAGRVLLDVDPAGAPRPGDPAGDGALLCQAPADIEALRVTDPALARRWRSAVRDRLQPAMAAGYRITAATRSGWYLLEAR